MGVTLDGVMQKRIKNIRAQDALDKTEYKPSDADVEMQARIVEALMAAAIQRGIFDDMLGKNPDRSKPIGEAAEKFFDPKLGAFDEKSFVKPDMEKLRERLKIDFNPQGQMTVDYTPASGRQVGPLLLDDAGDELAKVINRKYEGFERDLVGKLEIAQVPSKQVPVIGQKHSFTVQRYDDPEQLAKAVNPLVPSEARINVKGGFAEDLAA